MVRCELRAGVASIVLDAPGSKNALSPPLLEQLVAALRRAQDDPSCRAITLSGDGGTFCSGMDLHWAFEDGKSFDTAALQLYVDCLRLLSTARQPVIACVDGEVTAGGLGLVAACDIVLATAHSRFSLTEVIVGMVPALVTPFLLRRMALSRVRYMALSSYPILAQEAQVFGLVDHVVTASLSAAVDARLNRLLRSSPEALAVTKSYLGRLDTQDIECELGLARGTLLGWLDQPEVGAAIRDFAEGLSPPWSQRYRRTGS